MTQAPDGVFKQAEKSLENIFEAFCAVLNERDEAIAERDALRERVKDLEAMLTPGAIGVGIDTFADMDD